MEYHISEEAPQLPPSIGSIEKYRVDRYGRHGGGDAAVLARFSTGYRVVDEETELLGEREVSYGKVAGSILSQSHVYVVVLP